jgi:phytoene synthase
MQILPTPQSLTPLTAAGPADEAGIGPRRDPATVLAASTFGAGMLLLPPRLQRDARTLYKVLRTIDDLVDEQHPDAAQRVHAVEQWTDGGPAYTPESQTLDRLCQDYPISRAAINGFCQGMQLDLEGAEIETEADFERYCLLAGGTVGVILCGLLGTRHPDAEQRMERLGVAMQWTNILRDIDEDLASGRIYIPSSVIDRFGFPHPGQREQFLRDQIPRADACFVEGMTAIALLKRGQRAIGVSGTLYREILRQIEREGYGRKPGRASVPTGRKQKLIAAYQTPTPSTPAAQRG